MLKTNLIKFIFLLLTTILAGCSGVQTFQSTLRAGETAAVAAGWKHNFSRDNITVTVTPSIGAPIIYLPDDPAVRAVVNMYPDPLSSMVISDETNQDITPFAQTYALGTSFYTSGDKDWWQTVVFVDLPDSLPTGLTNIEISNSAGDSATSSLNIIDGIGQAEIFEIDQNGPMSMNQFSSLERVDHFVISFSASVIPHAIQINLSHDPDAATGGVGKAYVSNPRGDLKSIMWNDDGSNLQVLLTPTQIQPLSSMTDFKFYVSGGITNLIANNIVAVDINGAPLTGVTANVTAEK